MPNNRWRAYHKAIGMMNRHTSQLMQQRHGDDFNAVMCDPDYHGYRVTSIRTANGTLVITPDGWCNTKTHQYAAENWR